MTIQTALNTVPAIEWDDTVVFVFSWNNQQFFSGFVHLQISLASAIGIATQIGNITTQVQNQAQVAGDPQSWIDTVKNAARNNKGIAITFEDQQSTIYTTQTNTSFTLQTLFSLAG
jgi:hypothetical protein